MKSNANEEKRACCASNDNRFVHGTRRVTTNTKTRVKPELIAGGCWHSIVRWMIAGVTVKPDGVAAHSQSDGRWRIDDCGLQIM